MSNNASIYSLCTMSMRSGVGVDVVGESFHGESIGRLIPIVIVRRLSITYELCTSTPHPNTKKKKFFIAITYT